MSEYPNYTLKQLAELVLRLDVQEGLSPASLEDLQGFAKSALENSAQQAVADRPATLPESGENSQNAGG